MKQQQNWGDFCGLAREGMRRTGISLRELCRRAQLDPSLMSKVFSGKRNPPFADESIEKMAAALELDPATLFVALGKLPSAWRKLAQDQTLFEKADALVTGNSRPVRRQVMAQAPIPEELL